MMKRHRNRLLVGVGVGIALVHVVVRLAYGSPDDSTITTWGAVGAAIGALLLVSATYGVLDLFDVHRGASYKRKEAYDAIPGGIFALLAGLALTIGINAAFIYDAKERAAPSVLDMMNPLDLPEPLRPTLER